MCVPRYMYMCIYRYVFVCGCMSVLFIRVCACIYYAYMHVWAYVHTVHMYIYIFIYIYISTYEYTEICVNVYVHVYVYMCTYKCTYANTYALNLYVCIYIYLYVYVVLHVFVYVFVRTFANHRTLRPTGRENVAVPAKPGIRQNRLKGTMVVRRAGIKVGSGNAPDKVKNIPKPTPKCCWSPTDLLLVKKNTAQTQQYLIIAFASLSCPTAIQLGRSLGVALGALSGYRNYREALMSFPLGMSYFLLGDKRTRPNNELHLEPLGKSSCKSELRVSGSRAPVPR